VKDRPTLHGVLEELRAWAKENKFDIQSMPWGSWGDYDRVQFFRECVRKGLKYPFGRAHYNIKGLYSMISGQGKGFGVSKALKQIGMEFEGTPHRGVDDARMTAKILLHLLQWGRE
jgi:inhibitor of KinA sporulation pathway (predicted exonuclease)